MIVFFFKQRTAYEIKECDWSSDVCSSDLAYINQTLHLEVAEFDLATESWTTTSAAEPNLYSLSDATWGDILDWPISIAHDGTDIHVLFQPIYDVNNSLGGIGGRVAYNKLTGGVSGSWGTILRVPSQPTPAETGEAFIPVDNYASAVFAVDGRVHCLWVIGDKDNDGTDYHQLMQWQPVQASSTPVASTTIPSHQEFLEANLWTVTGGIPVVVTIGGTTYMALMVKKYRVPIAGSPRADVEFLAAESSASPTWTATKVTQVVDDWANPLEEYIGVDAACFAYRDSIRMVYHDGNGDMGGGTIHMALRTWSPVGGMGDQSILWDSENWQWPFGAEAASYWVFTSRVSSVPIPLTTPVYVIGSGPDPIPPVSGPGQGGSGIGSTICQYRNGFDQCLNSQSRFAGGIFAELKTRVDNQGTPPWVSMPENGQRFQKVGSLVLPADTGLDTLLLQFRIPLGYDGTILAVTNLFDGLGFIPGNGDLEWRVRINWSYLKDQSKILVNRGRLRNPWPLEGGG